MSKNMFRIIVCLLMSISVTVNAQNTSEAKLYGQGVHAYNNGEFDAALRIFNVAVEEGTDDPRVFLFRGLVLHTIRVRQRNLSKTYDMELNWKQSTNEVSIRFHLL